MKVYISASVGSIASRLDVSMDNVIEIVLERIDSSEIAAAEKAHSDIKPLSYIPEGGTEADRVYNDEAVAQYKAFCQAVLKLAETKGEVVGDDLFSPKSMSYYFTFFAKNLDGTVREKYMFFVRMSDHKLPQHHSEFVQKLRDQMFEMYREAGTLDSGIRQFDILVNGHRYKSYESALKDTSKRLQRMLNKHK